MTEKIPAPEKTPKIYFGDKDPKADELIRKQGWIIKSDEVSGNEVTPFSKPEGVETLAVEPNYFPEGAINNYLVYDPELSDVQVVKWGKPESKVRSEELLKTGYEPVDSNIARTIYIRSKERSSQ